MKLISQDRLIDFLIGGIAVGLVVWAVSRQYYREDVRTLRYLAGEAQDELSAIERRYVSSKRYSRNLEDWFTRDFFRDKREGVFLDVGANHYQNQNNTYFLEKELGWSGVAIDAQPEFGTDYATHRPRTRFVALFASDVADSSVTFFVPLNNKLVASSSGAFTVAEGAPGVPRQVPTTTLTKVLDDAKIPRVDFLSMDIELAEPKALAGFDIERFRPALVCIEAHPEVRQQILNYFTAHRYTVVGKYLRIDPTNLYFTPLQ